MTMEPPVLNRWDCKVSQFENAAIQILLNSPYPLTIKELVEAMISQELITVRGKTPHRSLHSLIQRKDAKRLKKGLTPVFKKIREGKTVRYFLTNRSQTTD